MMTELTDQQMQELRSRLEAKRAELNELVKSLGEVTGTKHDCAILDLADSASLHDMQRRAAALTAQHRETLAEIDAAIVRMGNGRYGISEMTGEPIAYQRLRAIPWARTGADDP